jgi:hypothetical protein
MVFRSSIRFNGESSSDARPPHTDAAPAPALEKRKIMRFRLLPLQTILKKIFDATKVKSHSICSLVFI